MSKARRLVWATAVLCAAVVARLPAQTPAPATPPPASTSHAAVVVVVNAENPVSQISMGDLRRILLGEMTRWPDGRNITIALRPPGQPERDAILRLVCSMTDAAFARYVLQAAYRGDAQSGIKLLDTSSGVRRFVFNVPGAIGFVRGDEVDGSVKAMKITGAIPTDAAFGLTLRSR